MPARARGNRQITHSGQRRSLVIAEFVGVAGRARSVGKSKHCRLSIGSASPRRRNRTTTGKACQSATRRTRAPLAISAPRNPVGASRCRTRSSPVRRAGASRRHTRCPAAGCYRCSRSRKNRRSVCVAAGCRRRPRRCATGRRRRRASATVSTKYRCHSLCHLQMSLRLGGGGRGAPAQRSARPATAARRVIRAGCFAGRARPARLVERLSRL